MPDQPRPRPSLLDETIAIHRALEAQLDSAGRQLLKRLDELRCDGIAAEQDRILTIVGQVAMQSGSMHLWRRMYAEAWPGEVGPGDAERFLKRATSGGATEPGSPHSCPWPPL
jgi:hypothetical protein